MNTLKTLKTGTALGTLIALQALPALAQDNGAARGIGSYGIIDEIIVTARKKAERLIDVPVAVSAISPLTLERYATNTFAAISEQVPQLIIGEVTTQVGGSINLRGVGAGQSNPATDNPVSINVDGIQVSQGNILQLGQYDVERVEVLRGPQTLFFGKNSPAGVISLVSKDPGEEFEAQVRAGYEAMAKQKFVEGIVSGPLGGGFGARLVGYFSDQDGWFQNTVTEIPGVSFPPAVDTGPSQSEIFLRGTLTYASPDGDFNARLKINYGEVDRDNGITAIAQRSACALGTPQLAAAVTDCTLDRFYANTNLSPSLAAATPGFGDGVAFFKTNQTLVSFEWDYALSETLNLTSVTGFFRGDQDTMDNFTQTDLPLVASRSNLINEQWTQELRLASNYEGKVNFLVGGFYQNANLANGDGNPVGFAAGLFGPDPFIFPISAFEVDTDALSVFGQVSVDVTDTLELTAGARYSHEEKEIGGTVGGAAFEVARPTRDFDDFSPEVTISYRPTDSTTIYASYREGFVSGGYNITATQAVGATIDPSFDQTTTRGGEIGVKGYLADEQIRYDLTAYYYKYKGLQVSAFDTQSVSLTTLNAASANVRGIEGNIFVKPDAIPGFDLQASAAFNRGDYGTFIGGCFGGQTIAQGCSLDPGAGGAFNSQDLSGEPLVRSPRWALSTTANYERPITSSLTGFASFNVIYSSAYQTMLEADPRAIQDGFFTVNANVTLKDPEGDWQLSVIARNITQNFATTSAFPSVLTGSGTGTATGVPADVSSALTLPRSVLLQLTVRNSLFQ